MGRRHWVVIEADAKQQYINASNRLRHAVTGSHIIHTLGTEWVPEVADSLPGVEVCVAISGKAILLVESREAGRELIEQVSRRALRDAAGLEVTGAVGPGFDPDVEWTSTGGCDNHVGALDATYRARDDARAARPAPVLRDPALPWFSLCRDTGYPVAGDEDHGKQTPDVARGLAQSSLNKWSAVGAARGRLKALVAGHGDLVPRDLDGLGEGESWLAVVHADGNGVGRIFTDLPERVMRAKGLRSLDLTTYVDAMSCFSRELECATEAAFAGAVDAVARRSAAGKTVDAGVRANTDATQGILPVVIGGDDVTFCCRADLALPLVEAFLELFTERTAAQNTIRQLAGSDNGLTAAAGIAFVKPHHPFSHALGLAEELTGHAKSVNGGPTAAADVEAPVASLDFQVLHDSTVAGLDALRSHRPDGFPSAHGGPYTLTEAAAGCPISVLRHAQKVIGPAGALSSAQTHDLRSGLALGKEEFQRRLERLLIQKNAFTHEDAQALWSEEEGLRLLDAMLLNGFVKQAAT